MRTTFTKLKSKYATGKGVGSTLGKWKTLDYMYMWFRPYTCKVKSARLKEVKRSNHTLKNFVSNLQYPRILWGFLKWAPQPW